MAEPDRRIHVAHLLDGRHFGGAEQMVRLLARAAAAAHVDSSIYVLSEGKLSDYLTAEGLKLRIFESRGRFDIRMMGKIARALGEERIELIQAHTSRTHLMARGLSVMTAIPNITTIHSPIALDVNRMTAGRPKISLRAMLERGTREWTKHIVCVSREEAERLKNRERVPETKISHIPNGVDAISDEELAGLRKGRERSGELGAILAARNLPEEALTVAMVAQLRPRKGAETLLRAWKTWREQSAEHPALLLIIGGDEFTAEKETPEGSYLESLKALACHLKVEREVHFAGFLKNPWRLAGAADAVALPSLFGEGLPLALLEAANHGIAVIASDIAGNREVIGEAGNGWLHPPGDAEALAAVLATAARDGAERQRRGKSGRRHFLTNWTAQAMAGRYRTLYERLVK